MAYGSAGKNRFAYIYRYNDGTVHVVIVQNAAGKQAVQRQFTVTQFDHDTTKRISGIRIIRKNESGAQPTTPPQPSSSQAIGASEESATRTISQQDGGSVNPPNYSITTPAEQARVAKALEAIGRAPDERLALYSKLKEQFDRMTVRSQEIIAAVRAEDYRAVNHEKVVQAIGLMNGILKVLPPEVRAKAGGLVQVASVAPMDVYRGNEKVGEVKSRRTLGVSQQFLTSQGC